LIFRAISVPLAQRNERARLAVIVLVAALLGLDVSVDRVRDRLVRAACSVLVDHGRPFAVVTHPRHQIPQARAAGRCERVARVPQIVTCGPSAPIDFTAYDQADILLKLPRRRGPPMTPGKARALARS
jgi:hypothetical protein